MGKSRVKINDVKKYWSKNNIPQQWYSQKEPLTVSFFNDLSKKRYEVYYSYLLKDAEFERHYKEDMLEIGVGIGTDLAQFAKNGAKVYGIDLGPDQIKMTAAHFNALGLSYENLEVASAEFLPYDTEKFDFVYSFGVLHHTPDTEKAIDEVYRVLKEDGHAVIMLYARGWKHYIKRCFFQGIIMGKWFKYGFDWQKVYNDVSEVNGGSPKTGVYTKRQVKNLFKKFGNVEIKKRRMGEFFEYKPYRSKMFPSFINNFLKLLGAEGLLGENWIICAYKRPAPKPIGILNILFKRY